MLLNLLHMTDIIVDSRIGNSKTDSKYPKKQQASLYLKLAQDMPRTKSHESETFDGLRILDKRSRP